LYVGYLRSGGECLSLEFAVESYTALNSHFIFYNMILFQMTECPLNKKKQKKHTKKKL